MKVIKDYMVKLGFVFKEIFNEGLIDLGRRVIFIRLDRNVPRTDHQ